MFDFFQDAIEEQAAQEQKTNQSALAEFVDLGQHELAGSGTELKPPPTSGETVHINSQSNGEQGKLQSRRAWLVNFGCCLL